MQCSDENIDWFTRNQKIKTLSDWNSLVNVISHNFEVIPSAMYTLFTVDCVACAGGGKIPVQMYSKAI